MKNLAAPFVPWTAGGDEGLRIPARGNLRPGNRHWVVGGHQHERGEGQVVAGSSCAEEIHVRGLGCTAPPFGSGTACYRPSRRDVPALFKNHVDPEYRC